MYRCLLLVVLGWTLAKPQLDFSPQSSAAGGRQSGVRVPYSPCSPTFDYQTWNGQVVGVAQVTPPRRSSLKEPIRLLITLRVDALLPSQYVGSVELTESKEEVFARLERGDNRPIWYRVLFPTQNPVPVLLSIEVNGEIVCQGRSPSSNGPMTTLKLDHSLFPGSTGLSPDPPTWQQPANQNQGFQQQTNQNTGWQTSLQPVQPSRPVQPVQPVQPSRPVQPNRPVRPPPPAPEVTEGPIQHNIGQESTNIECGKPVKIKPLVQHGSPSEQGDWPWLAAIFVKTNVGQDFQCGGSLVSTKHVVTAAHCVKDPNKAALSADSLQIILGKFNLRKTDPNSEQPRDASRVVMHPQYGGGKYDFDVAIIFLEYSVQFTATVRPVCIWPSSDSSLEGIINQRGTVVGWGRDELGNRVSEVPKEVTMPLVTQEECLRSHHNFYYLTSENTYCAGGRDGSGPCNGDSGGGMFFPERTAGGSTRWMLRGVVSLSLQDDSTKQCDLSNYIVFTDVAKFSSWMSGVMRT